MRVAYDQLQRECKRLKKAHKIVESKLINLCAAAPRYVVATPLRTDLDAVLKDTPWHISRVRLDEDEVTIYVYLCDQKERELSWCFCNISVACA